MAIKRTNAITLELQVLRQRAA